MNICYLLSSIYPHVRAWGTGGRGHAGAVERTVQALAKARDAGEVDVFPTSTPV